MASDENMGYGFVIYEMEWRPVSFGILDFKKEVEPHSNFEFVI